MAKINTDFHVSSASKKCDQKVGYASLCSVRIRLERVPRHCESIFVRIADLTVFGDENPEATRSSLVSRLRNWFDQRGWQGFFGRYWKLIKGGAWRPA